MREYELTVVYDLTVAEAGGPEAGPQRLTSLIEARGGKMLKVDHWGRRRLAYPINRAIDGDYVVTRVDFEPEGVAALEAALKIDERVFRHLIVRADELPPPPPIREPREMRQPAPVAADDEPADETAAAEDVFAEAVAPAGDAETPASHAPETAEPIDAVLADAEAGVDPEPVAAEEAAAEEPEAAADEESADEESAEK